MRILLVDTTRYAPTSPLFREAAAGLGHPFCFVDEAPFLAKLGQSLAHKIAYRLLRRRPLTYWLSPLCDLPVALRLWGSWRQRRHVWRGRVIDAGGTR